MIILKHLFLKASTPLEQIGSLYLLYAIFFKQPAQQYCKIRCTQSEWQAFRCFYEQLQSPDNDQARLIFWKLVHADAFRYVECEHEFGYELSMQKRDLPSTDNATCNTPEMMQITLTQIAREVQTLRDAKDGSVSALNLLQAGYNEMKEHLHLLPTSALSVDIDQQLSATDIMEEVTAGLTNIAELFDIKTTHAKTERLLRKRRRLLEATESNSETLAHDELASIGVRRQELKLRSLKCYGEAAETTPDEEQSNTAETGDIAQQSKKAKRIRRQRERVIRQVADDIEDVRRVDEQEREELLQQTQAWTDKELKNMLKLTTRKTKNKQMCKYITIMI